MVWRLYGSPQIPVCVVSPAAIQLTSAIHAPRSGKWTVGIPTDPNKPSKWFGLTESIRPHLKRLRGRSCYTMPCMRIMIYHSLCAKTFSGPVFNETKTMKSATVCTLMICEAFRTYYPQKLIPFLGLLSKRCQVAPRDARHVAWGLRSSSHHLLQRLLLKTYCFLRVYSYNGVLYKKTVSSPGNNYL